MKKWFGILVMGTALLFMLTNINKDKRAVEKLEVIQEIAEPSYEYNILVDSFNVIKGSVKRGQTMGEILYLNHIVVQFKFHHLELVEESLYFSQLQCVDLLCICFWGSWQNICQILSRCFEWYGPFVVREFECFYVC